MAKIEDLMMPKDFIKPIDIPEKGYKEKVVKASVDSTGKFGPRIVFEFAEGLNKNHRLSLNPTSLGLWVKKYGRESDSFIGKMANLKAAVIGGNASVICEPV